MSELKDQGRLDFPEPVADGPDRDREPSSAGAPSGARALFGPDIFDPDRALEDARAQLAGLLGGPGSEVQSQPPSPAESQHPAFELHRGARAEGARSSVEVVRADDTLRPEPLAESELANEQDLDTSFDELAVDLSDPRFETADDPRIPPGRSFFKIGEAAKITGVKPYVLRYWETEFSWIRPTKTSARQRLYRRQDLALILQIRRLRYREQQTIAAVREAIKADRGERSDRGKKRRRSQAPVGRPSQGFASRELVMAIADMRSSLLELLRVVED